MEKHSKCNIELFGNVNEKTRHSFILFDIVDFYPSISEKLLDQALSWASSLADISDEDISIIEHGRKLLIFNNGKSWIKNNNANLFDVTMGIGVRGGGAGGAAAPPKKFKAEKLGKF